MCAAPYFNSWTRLQAEDLNAGGRAGYAREISAATIAASVVTWIPTSHMN